MDAGPTWVHTGTKRPVSGSSLAGQPEELPLIVARATAIEATDIPGEQEAIVLPIFVVIASSGWAPVVPFARARRAFTVKLDQAKTWMSRNNAAIMSVLFLVLQPS